MLLQQAIGTHAGMVYVLSHKGVKLNEYRAHGASVMAIEISDDGSEFIGTCSIDGSSSSALCPRLLSI